MKNKVKQISSLLILVLVISLYSACKKTTDKPHITPTTIGGTLTISQLKSMFAENNGKNIKFTQDISLFATVTMTDNYKTLYIKDQTGAISLKQLTAHGIFAGDSLRINLNNSTLDQSAANSSLQIDSVDVSDSPTCKVVKLAVGRPLSPITVTISQLKNSASDTSFNGPTGSFFLPRSKYDGQLVQINDVQFSFANRINYIPYGSPTYVNPPPVLFDCGGIYNLQLSLYSGTADFQNQPIPYTKSGSIVGAISFYNNILQITPRSFADVNFNQPRCGMQTLNQTFDTIACGTGGNISGLFPGWGNINQIGSQLWVGATAGGPTYFPSGVVNSFTPDTLNVSWLITPPIQNSPTKNINFGVYTNNNPGYDLLSVLVSTDYNGSNLGVAPLYQIPVGFGAMATWVDITSSFNIIKNNPYPSWAFQNAGAGSTGSNAIYFNATNASTLIPSSYTGTFYVGFRYRAKKNYPDSAAGYGINNVVIKD